MESHERIPIWFFIGSVLLIYGVLILGVGLYGLVQPSTVQVKLLQSWPEAPWLFLHADIWWGLLMATVGAIYCVKFNPRRGAASE